MDQVAKEKCGVFGVWDHPEAAHLTFTALYAQQHRGQESAGIASIDSMGQLQAHVGMGLVPEVFDERLLDSLESRYAIGHNRYSTTGSSRSCNAQPLLREYVGGQVALGHNGNLINADLLRADYEGRGHMFQSSTDTEVILVLLATHHLKFSDPLVETLTHLQGAYSLVFLFHDRIEAVRDPWGWRPLWLGRLRGGPRASDNGDGDGDGSGSGGGGGWCVASETVVLDAIGAEPVREVEPGEIVTLSDRGVESRRFAERRRSAHCAFEHVYFANPSSRQFGDTVQIVRERLGETLAAESPAPGADCVIPMPDSGRSAALGYSRASGLPYREGIVPNRYVGRTFIKPTQRQRDAAVALKLNTVEEVVCGKKLVVVDDSIVRGTTTQGKMKALRKAGAREIHLRISCPPIRHPCYYGIDFADPSRLIARTRTVEEIRDFLNVDSLAFLSIEGLLSCMSQPPGEYCTACWSGEYRIEPTHPVHKLDLERHQLRMFAAEE